jgi:hypothetical protein
MKMKNRKTTRTKTKTTQTNSERITRLEKQVDVLQSVVRGLLDAVALLSETLAEDYDSDDDSDPG